MRETGRKVVIIDVHQCRDRSGPDCRQMALIVEMKGR